MAQSKSSKQGTSSPAIMLVAYNRPAHFEKVLKALIPQEPPLVTIVFDAPSDSKSEEAQTKMKKLLSSQKVLNTRIIQSSSHQGVAKTVVGAVHAGLEAADSVIILEDDCVPAPGFLDYMNQALSTYRTNNKVRSICGYLPPFALDDESPDRARASYRFVPWGWATWRDRWSDYSLALDPIVQKLQKDSPIPFDLGNYISDAYFTTGKADLWSLSWSVLHYLTGTFCVFPPVNLVHNIGFDGSGVHSTTTRVFENPVCLETPSSIEFPKILSPDYAFDIALNAFLAEHSSHAMIKRDSSRPASYEKKTTDNKTSQQRDPKRGRKNTDN